MAIRLSNSASIPARYLNRHCLITGPTGTGKTVTIMRLIESTLGVGAPVFCADVKGDLANMAHTPARATVPVWAFGAELLSRALELTDAQSGALEIAFEYADESASPLDTLAHLRLVLATLAHDPNHVAHIGHVTRASIGTIQRALLRLEKQGATALFAAPALDVGTMIDTPRLHLLDARALYHSPALYGAFLLYILRELATRMPESGDLDRPRLVLVFDEAHTVFHEASPALLRSVEATARLIRSKGIGLIWASQSADDVPAIVRAQCATRVEHTRALGIGRAYFSTLDGTGRPTATVTISPLLPSTPLGTPPAPAQHIAPTPAPAIAQDIVPIALAVAAVVGVVGAALFTFVSPVLAGITLAGLATVGAIAAK